MVIQCPHCEKEMEEDKENIFCSKCGILFIKKWIIETAMILGYEEGVKTPLDDLIVSPDYPFFGISKE